MSTDRNIQEKDGRRVTLTGVVVNVVLISLKITTGILGNSKALIADAVHSISDLFTDIVVLFGIGFGRKAPDERHQFGHARIETLASSIVGVALITTAIYIGVKAVMAIYYHEINIPKSVALLGAAISILSKEALYHYTVQTGKRIKSQLIVANAWHHRSDAMSSVAVFIGVGGALINPDWHILDSFAALLVSFFIVKVGIDILVKSIMEITDAAPSPEIIERIKNCSLCVKGVLGVHDIRVRTSGGLYQMETHIVVDGGITVIEGHGIAKAVEKCLLDEIEDIDRIIVHIDPGNNKLPSL